MIIRSNLRYAMGIPGFLRSQITPSDARTTVEKQIASREESFLRIVERGIYENAASPYRLLLEHAGVALADVREMVRIEGLEGALSKLYDAGVYVTYEESRGLAPIRRGSLKIPFRHGAFDNPLLVAGYQGQTSGSRGAGRRLRLDLDFLAHEACEAALLFGTHDLRHGPMALWWPIPPDTAGVKHALIYTKIGRRPERWYSQGRLHRNREGSAAAVILAATLLASRLATPLPIPRYVPRDRAGVIAAWLAQKRRDGTPGCLDTSASGAVRVCLAATERGFDIGGSTFRIGGEPYTQAKADVLASAGCRAIQQYGMVELGWMGMGCGKPTSLDDMHLATDKVAFIQRAKQVAGAEIPALVYTSVLTSCPMLMLNMESGDYCTLTERSCGCLLDEVGLKTHLTDIRSYDKLTSDGVTFVGSELYRLVDEVLPARFGGHPTDYQLVEEDDGGLARLSIVVAPGVGAVDEEAVVTAVFDALTGSYGAGGRPTAEYWRQGKTLSVVRREPYASGGGRKVLPLHVAQSKKTGIST